MKAFKILLLIILSAVSLTITGQEIPDKKAEQREKVALAVKNTFESGKIEIVIDKIIPKSRINVDVTGDYEIQIKNDSLTCYLPYIGESLLAPADPSKIRIEFKDEKLSIQKSNPRPGIYLIKFTTKADVGIETFSFSITIFESAFCIINMIPSDRDYITYHGTLKY